ncbi:MAG: flagellar protein FlgN [Sedimenticola sp.]|nr:flagellar protein FlgN [Sedimenticola sp.]
MALSADQQQQLSQLVSAEYACAQSLLELLQKEQQILKSADADALESISQEKQQLVIRMHRQARQREQLVDRLQAGGDINELLKTLSGSEPARLWQQLGEIAARLQQQNEINGGMVALNQRHTRQALDILCGRSGNREIYGARGEYRQMESGKPLAKA